MKNIDLRILRTHKLLTNALLELLDTKPFEEISVVDICEKAMVHRTTFYKHFEDKYQLLNYTLEGIKNHFEQQIISNHIDETPYDYYCAMIKLLLGYISENKRWFTMLLKHNKNNSFTNSIHTVIYNNIVERLTYYQKMGFNFNIPIDFLANYRTGALISVATWLISENHKYTEGEIFTYLTNIFELPKKKSTT